MISKISYIKLIREDIRHRGWLAALSGVLLFLSMPVYTLIYLDSYSEDPEVLKEFADTFSGFINGYNSAFLIILIGILAFAVGISGFQFMHKKEKLDFYHGLALKRHQLFAISYLAGLFLFLIPYIVCLESSITLSRVLLPQIGQIIHSEIINYPSPFILFYLIFLFYIYYLDKFICIIPEPEFIH